MTIQTTAPAGTHVTHKKKSSITKFDPPSTTKSNALISQMPFIIVCKNIYNREIHRKGESMRHAHLYNLLRMHRASQSSV